MAKKNNRNIAQRKKIEATKARKERRNTPYSPQNNSGSQDKVSVVLTHRNHGTVVKVSKVSEPQNYLSVYEDYGVNEKSIKELAKHALWTVVMAGGDFLKVMVADPTMKMLSALDWGFITELMDSTGYKKGDWISVINGIPSINNGDLIAICDDDFPPFVESYQKAA